MANPVVHFEIIGKDAGALRDYYNKLFGWNAKIVPGVAPEISDEGNYGFIDKITAEDGTGIRGGIGGGQAFESHALFYVGVPDVETALRNAEKLGGKRIMGPVNTPGGGLVIGHFTDPEGNLIGVAGRQ
jgi:predicted enzyme related to lactoylglutathione lyase